ncbi:MAG TPA: hypothetical protein VF450_16320, partial [Noviherbaspirillum sp.]
MNEQLLSSFSGILGKMEKAITRLRGLIRQGYSCAGTASGGKDSSCEVFLLIEAIRRESLEGFTQARHYVTSADTTIENPSMLRHLELFLEDVQAFCAHENLPVTAKIAKPSLASQFVTSTIGRGTLVRTPENSVKDGKAKRPCSEDWKISPQQRLRKQLADEVQRDGFRETITILGTRFEESTSRALNMERRGENDLEPVRGPDGYLTYSPIADWTVDDVWEMLGMFTDDKLRPFPAPASIRTVNRMHELYRAGNEGTCGVVLGDGGNKAACGSRFGCAFCCISGDRDKSMESMIKDPNHAHLAGLNQFRNYLLATQWDMSKRELVGRTLSKAGYVRVQPDTYSFSHRMALLRYLLTLDVLESERAENHEEDLYAGKIPDTEENRELCDAQFEMITPQQLIAIDFMLGLHHYAPHGHPALCAWYEVRHLG